LKKCKTVNIFNEKKVLTMSFNKNKIIICLLSMIFRAYSIDSTKAEACMILAAYGDVLGRVTEFKKTLPSIFKTHQHGVCKIDDFIADDWKQVPPGIKGKQNVITKSYHTAPYTDDTRMSIFVAGYLLLQTRKLIHFGTERISPEQSQEPGQR
jgi:hypothetical protein